MKPDLVTVCPHDTAHDAKRWGRLAAYLNERTGISGRFQAYANFREFRTDLGRERFLWAYLNPADFVLARARFGYRAIARPRDRFDVALVVHRGPQAILGSLSGKRLAAVPGYLCAVVRRQLGEEGVRPVRVEAASYNDVMTLLENGEADFGVTYAEHFDRLAPAIRDAYSLVLRVDSSLSHVFATHPAMPETHTRALTAVLLGGDEGSEFRRLLDELTLPAFEAFDEEPFERLVALLEDA